MILKLEQMHDELIMTSITTWWTRFSFASSTFFQCVTVKYCQTISIPLNSPFSYLLFHFNQTCYTKIFLPIGITQKMNCRL